MDIRELIIGLRGGVPNKCDFCGEDFDEHALYPEEAGMWICIDCIQKDKEAYFGTRQTE